MPRSFHLLAGLLALAVLVLAVFWFSSSPVEVPIGPAAAPVAAPAGAPVAVAGEVGAVGVQEPQRTAVSARAASRGEDDPEIAAALAGYVGRVVDAKGTPVADCGVRLVRLAVDEILKPSMDLMDPVAFEPTYVAGAAQTGSDGRFRIEGVFPRAVFLLQAGIGTDAPGWRMLQQVPGPGEVVDLGDVVLADLGVVTGVVVDEEGAPLADAWIRAIDLPATLLGVFPFERIDPKGHVIVRQEGRGTGGMVMSMPPWVERAFEDLPVPTTRSGPDGRFRLTGLTPGNNTLVTVHPRVLADLRGNVTVKGGEERDIGQVRMRAGEELFVVVRDTAGKPVAGAEVVAGPTTLVAPVDPGSPIGVTDANGQVSTTGFPKGKVTAAARRSAKDPWTIAEPQSVNNDVEVTLPAQHRLTLAVLGPDGKPPAELQVRMLRGNGNDGVREMALLGFAKAVDVGKELVRQDDGSRVLERVAQGKLGLLVQAPGTAVKWVEAEVQGDTRVEVQLASARSWSVTAFDPAGKPLRNVTVFAQDAGSDRMTNMPLGCGRTDAQGRLRITKMGGSDIRVSGSHPRYGSAAGTKVEGTEEFAVRFEATGSIEGVLTTAGRPPQQGAFTVLCFGNGRGGADVEDMPTFHVPDAEGKFAIRGLQPRMYTLQVVRSFELVQSGGSLFRFVQNEMLNNSLPSERAQVPAGGVAQVQMETDANAVTGPSGRIAGIATINGMPATECMVSARFGSARRGVRVAEDGSFSFDALPAGRGTVELQLSAAVMGDRPPAVWGENLELKAGDLLNLRIEAETATVEGTVLMPDGSPAPGASVNALVVPIKAGSVPVRADVRQTQRVVTDAKGVFRMEHMPVGRWNLIARARGEVGGRAVLQDLELLPRSSRTGLVLRMEATTTVKGRIEWGSIARGEDSWDVLTFTSLDMASGLEGLGTFMTGTNSDTFEMPDVLPGRYRVTVRPADSSAELEHPGEVVVPAGGLEGLVLMPRTVPKPEPQPKQGQTKTNR
ncbi:MAG: hypothetical protein RL148_2552 [Planctomycetota bacterium]